MLNNIGLLNDMFYWEVSDFTSFKTWKLIRMTNYLDYPTIISVIIGGSITIAFQWYVIRKEDRSNQNVVIFYLLEIHSVLSRLIKLKKMDDDFLISFFERLMDRGEINNEQRDLLKKRIFNLVFNISYKDLESIRSNYEKSVEILAREKPILAYRVKDLSQVVERCDLLANSLLILDSDYKLTPEDFTIKLKEFYINLSIDDSLKLIKKSILSCIPLYAIREQIQVRKIFHKSSSIELDDIEMAKNAIADLLNNR